MKKISKKVSRKVKVTHPSFPKVPLNRPLKIKQKKVWQVLLGDKNHYRVGIYSPKFSSVNEINEFEKHTIKEFFMLIEGNLSLVLCDNKNKGRKKIIKLKPLQPVFVDTWHNGFCPDGPFTGKAIVVERDLFTTFYINN
ncbi:MAG: hypothetical protein HQK49_05815 [Oligoflexia bacterium]|nr:hypothetical protein [Oligoflexia bacterium]